jgi:hypothetical protein
MGGGRRGRKRGNFAFTKVKRAQEITNASFFFKN